MGLVEANSIANLLQGGEGGAPAIGSPEGTRSLSYRELDELVSFTVERLNELGVGRSDRVASVISNGPEAATAFLSIAAGATAAPLNPAYRHDEFHFYLSDLRAKALVVEAGLESPVRQAARELSLPVIELHPRRDRGAGSFTLEPLGPSAGRAVRGGFGSGEDTALVLHTSGTTARPKIVPLLQRNLLVNACHIANALALTPGDVCLNVMPLFHIHGLMAGTLASLAAGAEVSCAPHFNALKFFVWLDEVRPTWYTAVPTMHEAALARADRHREVCERARIRLVRSSSARLAPRVMKELENAFDAPVIESYGMTETSHQITSNPLPPAERLPGSVGMAAGPEVAIMGPQGELLPTGHDGEVVVRGRNVMEGYENNPQANAQAFCQGWFRTGDQGFLDGAKRLHITGRLKELINRGGEKISPSEVDEALLHHPDVQQAVTFAVRHDKLGEEVAAAVVLREGRVPTDHEIKDFVAQHLAHFKVPRKIVFVREIPRGPTGKLQRIGLAGKLGLE